MKKALYLALLFNFFCFADSQSINLNPSTGNHVFMGLNCQAVQLCTNYMEARQSVNNTPPNSNYIEYCLEYLSNGSQALCSTNSLNAENCAKVINTCNTYKTGMLGSMFESQLQSLNNKLYNQIINLLKQQTKKELCDLNSENCPKLINACETWYNNKTTKHNIYLCQQSNVICQHACGTKKEFCKEHNLPTSLCASVYEYICSKSSCNVTNNIQNQTINCYGGSQCFLDDPSQSTNLNCFNSQCIVAGANEVQCLYNPNDTTGFQTNCLVNGSGAKKYMNCFGSICSATNGNSLSCYDFDASSSSTPSTCTAFDTGTVNCYGSSSCASVGTKKMTNCYEEASCSNCTAPTIQATGFYQGQCCANPNPDGSCPENNIRTYLLKQPTITEQVEFLKQNPQILK